MLEEVDDEKPPKVELSQQELTLSFRKHDHPDLKQSMLSTSLSKFCLPGEGEGFDEIRYIWHGASEASDYLQRWALERKLATPVEDLQPGEWFRQQRESWSKDIQAWQVRLKEHRAIKLNPTVKAGAAAKGDGGK